MKSHYCHEEKAIIEFTGQCNWCGEKEMNNEPVAWTDGRGNYFDKNSFFPVDDLIPLYTHPAKTLTDEEIEECFEESCTDFKLLENGKTKGVVNIIDVGRAILRKAQEK